MHKARGDIERMKGGNYLGILMGMNEITGRQNFVVGVELNRRRHETYALGFLPQRPIVVLTIINIFSYAASGDVVVPLESCECFLRRCP